MKVWRPKGVLAALLFVALTFSCALPKVSFASEPVLEVGLTGKYPPFNYFDAAGKLVGFDVDVAQSLCKRMKRRCVFKTLQWDGILAALLAGKIDVIIGSMAITPEREKHVTFTDPYYESGAQLFVRDESIDPHTPGFRIGVTLGTTYETFVREKFPRAEVRTYKGEPVIFQDLQAGRLDAMLTDKLVGAYMNEQRHAALRLSGPPLYIEKMGIPTRPGRTALLEELNTALRDLRASPKYQDLMSHYFGSQTTANPDARQPAFGWSTAIGLLLKGLAATAKVAAAGLAIGLLMAGFLSWLLITTPAWIRMPTLVYVDFIRSTPFMIQLFAIYFGLPALGIKLQAWNAATLAIAIHVSSYLSEIVKSAYLSIPVGQHQAAATLGLTRLQTLRHVILPQMLPVLTAPVLNTLVAMIKDSAIVSVISVYELTLQTQQLISATFRPEFYAIAALLYAIITYPMLVLGRWQERRYKMKGLFHET